MARSILGIVLGIVVAVLVVAAIEGVSSAVYPMPPGLDPKTDPEGLAAFVRTLPVGAFLFVALAWFLGALAGGSLAAWVARRQPIPAVVVILFPLVGAVLTLVAIPGHPAWFWAVGLLTFPLAAFLATRLRVAPAASP